MDLPCETETRVQNELALRFSVASKPTPISDYVKTIASYVGASHILAVFEENDTLKVFFDDKRLIDSLIRRGMHVLGQHVKVDYVVPPGTKVICSNIDPVIPNLDLTDRLSKYGVIVSPIICPPIIAEADYCHINYGVRYCYMLINEQKPIPSKFEFMYGDQLCTVKVTVGDELPLLPVAKIDEEWDVSDTDNAINDHDASEPAPSSDIDEEDTSRSPVVIMSSLSETINDMRLATNKLPIKRSYVKRKGQSQPTLKIKQTKETATSRAAKRIKKNNFKQKWIGSRGIMALKKRRKNRENQVKLLKPGPVSPATLPSVSHNSSDIDDALPSPSLATASKDFPGGPLEREKLLEFIDACRHNRAPIELAKKYLGSGDHVTLLRNLINQIKRYAESSENHSLKVRLKRLCKMLNESLPNSIV